MAATASPRALSRIGIARDRELLVEAERLSGDPEHSFAQLVELQVLLQLVLVEVVARLAAFLGVIPVVLRLDLDVLPFGAPISSRR